MDIIQGEPHIKNIEILLANCCQRRYPAKATIIHLGDKSDTLYYIISGSVAAIAEDNGGKEITLAHLNAGDFVGEMGLFERGSRSACIRTRSDCEMGEISYSRFLNLSAKHPDLLFAVAQQVTNRLRNTSRKVCDLAFLDVSGRVAHSLLYLCEEPEAKPCVEGTQIRVTRQEISRIVGCSREMVGRVLKDLEESGLITTAGKNIVVFKTSRGGLLPTSTRYF